MPSLTQEQKEDILDKKAQGLSIREIARQVLEQESRESTVRRFLRGVEEESVEESPKLNLVGSESGLEGLLKVIELTKKVNRVSSVKPAKESSLYTPRVATTANGKTILVIADLQIKPDVSLDYCRAVGNYIASKKPDIIVNIGDTFDLKSLSMYDKGKLSFEGRRLIDDINVGKEGLRLVHEPHQSIEGYNPEMYFCVGNHEHRADRFSEDQPELKGYVGVEHLGIEEFGYTVVPFLIPIELEGILFSHYFSNKMTGKPLGGNAQRMLNVIKQSFVAGHSQKLEMAIDHDYKGKPMVGIVAGACYDHYESYKGHHNEGHFRGLVVLHEAKEGAFLPMPVSLEYMMNNYL